MNQRKVKAQLKEIAREEIYLLHIAKKLSNNDTINKKLLLEYKLSLSKFTTVSI